MVAGGVSAATQKQKQQARAEQRLAVFRQRYGNNGRLADWAVELAGYAAFPLTLTTDLAYHLRERFVPDAPWYLAADLLLSGLCDPVGHDLYEMAAATRIYLLEELFERWRQQGLNVEAELKQLADFVGAYILHRLELEPTQRAKRLGDPTEWLALACLYPAEQVAQRITEAMRLLAEDDPEERFRLANMVESVGDLLAQRGLEPIELRRLAQRIEDSEPIDEIDRLRQAMQSAGFPPLDSIPITYATLVFDAAPDAEELHSWAFETVTIDRQGREIQRQSHNALAFTEPLAPGISLEMVAIPSGSFQMGSPSEEHQRYGDEDPQHEVTVPPFFISQTLVTQAQWRVVAGWPQELRAIEAEPSNFNGDDLPVEQVSWLDAEEFCLRLSRYANRAWDYRLPTEAEWEYACRAGTTTPFHFGETITSKMANYSASVVYQKEKKGKASNQTTPVKAFLPNAFGLYDMHGNLWEWCQDDWHDNYNSAPTDGNAWLSGDENSSKVLRGGSWIDLSSGLPLCLSQSHLAPGLRSERPRFSCCLCRSQDSSVALCTLALLRFALYSFHFCSL